MMSLQLRGETAADIPESTQPENLYNVFPQLQPRLKGSAREDGEKQAQPKENFVPEVAHFPSLPLANLRQANQTLFMRICNILR